MGTSVDTAIIDYRLPINDCLKANFQVPTVFPINDYGEQTEVCRSRLVFFTSDRI